MLVYAELQMSEIDESDEILVKQVIMVLRSFPARTATLQEVHTEIGERLMDVHQPASSIPPIQAIRGIASHPRYRQVFERLDAERFRLK
jgi:hypothetical protein